MSGSLLEWLEESRHRGFLGPGPVLPQIAHARALTSGIDRGVVVDLGSGGGLPGLVLAVDRPDLQVVLLEVMERRCAFLTEALTDLGSSAQVLQGRAEELSHDPLVRHTADFVVARSFAPPAPTAEIAAGLLRRRGALIVSEPPDGGDRWPAEPLAALGLRVEAHEVVAVEPHGSGLEAHDSERGEQSDTAALGVCADADERPALRHEPDVVHRVRLVAFDSCAPTTPRRRAIPFRRALF